MEALILKMEVPVEFIFPGFLILGLGWFFGYIHGCTSQLLSLPRSMVSNMNEEKVGSGIDLMNKFLKGVLEANSSKNPKIVPSINRNDSDTS